MTSEKRVNNVPSIEDKEMENVQLHRAESMVNDDIDLSKIIKDDKMKDKPKKLTSQDIKRKINSVISEILNMKVEVVMFLYMFSYVLRSITSMSMIMDKVCLVHLEYPIEVCRNLSGYETVKLEVEKLANNYHLGHTLTQMLPSAFLALFIGSWSDKYSRKIPIIAALIGIIIDGFGTTFCAYYFNSRVEYYFIPAVFTGISGGFISVLTILYSYVSDITTTHNRTMKYALVEMAFGIAMPFGLLFGGYIFKYAGYVPVFLTSTCGHVVALFFVILILEETRGLKCRESLKEKLYNIWNTDSVVESFKASIKKRPDRGREQIWWLMVAMSVAVFNFASIATIAYIYVHHRYDWDNTTYSTVYAIFQIASIIVILIVVPLCKKKNIGDPILGVVGSVSLMIKNIGIGIASQTWIYYIASLLGLFTALGTLAGRARISKIIPKEDLGKVFAFLSTIESVLPIAGSALTSQVLNATLDNFPGLIYIIMGILISIPIGVYIWLYRLPVTSYGEMNDDAQNENNFGSFSENKVKDSAH